MAYSLERTVKDSDLVPISGAQVYVYDETGALANLVTSGGAPTSNPVTSDSLGYAAIFTAEAGFYTLKFYWGGRLRLVEAQALAGNPPLDTAVAEATAQAVIAEGFALTLEANASGGFYASLTEGVADADVAIGEAFNIIADGRHQVGLKTASDAGEIVVEYSTTGILGGLGHKTAEQYGAVGDGTTVDTAALQAAIDAVSAAGGGTVELAAKAYRTGTLALPANVMLIGQGRYATRLVATTGLSAPLINRAGSSGSVINRGGVANLAIVGSGKANTGMIGIKNVYTNRGTFRDIDIFACRRGMWIENVWQDALDNIHVHGGGSDQNYMGFYFAPKAATVGVSNAVIATGCMAQGVEQWGFRIENANGSKFTACEASDGVHAWYIGDPSSGTETTEFCHFVNCLGDTTSGHIWRIEKGAATAVRRMHFANCWAGNSTAGSGVYVAGASELAFTGWQVVSAYLHGFHFYQSSRCPLSGSNIRNWNTAAGASNGVYLQDSSVIKVVGCEIASDTLGAGKGFVEAGTSDSNTLVASNSAAGWTITGAATTQTGNTSL